MNRVVRSNLKGSVLDKESWFVVAVVFLMLALFVVPIIVKATAKVHSVGIGSVVQKTHVPATHDVEIQLQMQGDILVPVLVNTSTPEEWIVFVRLGNSVFEHHLDSLRWSSFEEGCQVEVFELRGRCGVWRRSIEKAR